MTPAFLDKSAFPFESRIGAELVRAMETIFPSINEALQFADRFHIRTSDLRKENDIRLLWRVLLRRFSQKRKLRDLVTETLTVSPKNSYHEFLNDLLNNSTPIINAERVSFKETLRTEKITDKEAFLFHDDLTIGIAEIDSLISTLDVLSKLARSVCHIAVDCLEGKIRGTGFKITTQTILTNHHVLFPNGKAATEVVVKFGFDREAGESGDSIEKFTGDLTSLLGEMEADWAVIDLNEPSPQWPAIDLSKTCEPRINERAFIIQHPNGNHKRLGFVRNKISEVEGMYVRYLTDTAVGSSGAPVFDALGHIIAIHHRGGRPVEVAGKPPIVKNEGILIAHILERYARLSGSTSKERIGRDPDAGSLR